ncbi:hypothetical protein J4573_25165 [Actinomadura barringtoniae]|uniref:SRPBCC family protein n=1 Tax=Actinomadura barringtoniae TaxID=1427535 RepID=A0A939PCP1_9ACTN|nr:hypothetical protein [Actinomadura barringtoniae]MBO2450417.1 hypothetical protein [Actinomadura barringtoniae]
MRVQLTGHVNVPQPATDSLQLFTPRGEERWVPGWKPRFPEPAPDDTAPGTVFETTGHGETTTWVVIDRTPDRVSYARVTPGSRAGTVTVQARDTTVEVTYDLTALSAAAEPALEEFAAGYGDFLKGWEAAIAEAGLA